jgi:hypothetical protein
MRRLWFLVAVSLMAWSDPDLPQVPPDPKVDNTFARLNPGYRTRAGQFYEKDYLPQALAALQRGARLTPAQLPRARATVRVFLYRWLDAYVAAGGQQTDSGCSEQVAWLDRQFASWLEAAQLEGYQRWKSDPDNALGFLFRPR